MPRDLESLKFILEQCREIEKLYGISEAEIYLMNDMLATIQSLGHSPKLSLKLLKATAAILEMAIDNWNDKKD